MIPAPDNYKELSRPEHRPATTLQPYFVIGKYKPKNKKIQKKKKDARGKPHEHFQKIYDQLKKKTKTKNQKQKQTKPPPKQTKQKQTNQNRKKPN